MASGEGYRELAEAGWAWVLDQVRGDDGPWLPESVPDDGSPAAPAYDRDSLYSGIGGLAPALAEIALSRALTEQEQALAVGIAGRLSREARRRLESSLYDGLAGDAMALRLLAPGTEIVALQRLADLMSPDGWETTLDLRPGSTAPLTDLVAGTAGVVLAALWLGGEHSPDIAVTGGEALLRVAEETEGGLDWRMYPGCPNSSPNFSHGTAGVAAALALTGHVLGRDDLVEAARLGAEHLVTLGGTRGGGFAVPHYLPGGDSDEDEVTYTWCHGPTGTSLLFLALDRAGVRDVAGEAPLAWHARCLHRVRNSGVPERLHPGFWDNDGRCCGTAGVGDVFLDCYQRSGEPADLQFAVLMANALVERAYVDGSRAWWRFIEHRNPEPLLPPGVGWLQGGAGIATFLLRIGRVLEQGVAAPAVSRMDNWWALPATDRLSRPRPRE